MTVSPVRNIPVSSEIKIPVPSSIVIALGGTVDVSVSRSIAGSLRVKVKVRSDISSKASTTAVEELDAPVICVAELLVINSFAFATVATFPILIIRLLDQVEWDSLSISTLG